MKFGFNVNMRNSAEEILELGDKLIKTGEFHAIEVTYSEHMRHIDTSAYNQAIKQLVKMYGAEVVVHISDFNLGEENIVLQRAILEEFENCCKYVREFDGSKIVMHCGSRNKMHISIRHEDGTRQTHEEVYQKMWNLSVETMKSACIIAQKYNIAVLTENLANNTLIQTAKQLLRYLADVNEKNLFIVYDSGHGHFTGNNVYEEILQCGDKLKHLHLHDNHGEKDEHLPAGSGTISWKDFCESLRKVDYSGIYMMELYHSTYEGLMKSKNTLMRYL